mmetsp:Transcript_29934/g.66212  ORF Transcript_29934/g.66212 Transcript_29934/m.66212 type:complete len:387 (-) Transcript_29934:35-1195(-)
MASCRFLGSCLTLLLFAACLVYAACSGPLLLFPSLLLSVSRQRFANSRRQRTVASFDEFGALPQVQNAYAAINRAKPVVAFRTANATVVAFRLYESESKQLFVSMGCDPLQSLTSAEWVPGSSDRRRQHFLLVSGIAGDCRMLSRHAKELVLNHTVAFAAPPTGLYIAERLGAYLQGHTAGSSRPLACHCFVISTPLRTHAGIGSSSAQDYSMSSNTSSDAGNSSSTGSDAGNSSSVSAGEHGNSSIQCDLRLDTVPAIQVDSPVRQGPRSALGPPGAQGTIQGKQGTIYEVSCAGGVWRIAAGMAGRGMLAGKKMLEDLYPEELLDCQKREVDGGGSSGTQMSLDECKRMVSQVFQGRSPTDRAKDEEKSEEPVSFKFFVFPDEI